MLLNKKQYICQLNAVTMGGDGGGGGVCSKSVCPSVYTFVLMYVCNGLLIINKI